MNAPQRPEVLPRKTTDHQARLPLVTDGVERWVWEGQFGAILIEAVDGQMFVNGQPVLPHGPVDPVAAVV